MSEAWMASDSTLIEKREELKYRLAAGEYKTLVDVLLAGTDRLIRKITRRSKVLPIWFLGAIWMVVLPLIMIALLYPTGGITIFNSLADVLALDHVLSFIWLMILPGMLATIFLVLINQYISRIFLLWRDEVIDATESLVSLEQFEDWLKKICDRKLHMLLTFVLGLMAGLYSARILYMYLGKFVGYGVTFTIALIYIIGFPFFYLLLMVILLSARLRTYDLKLFAADPASSEILSRLSGVLSIFVYFVSAYAVYLTGGTMLAGLFSTVGIAAFLILFIPVTIMFILNQVSLSSIIRRAKWKTLNEIQAKVESLQLTDKLTDKETIDAINRLMDYHDRVKRTRNSAIDLGATLNFINSLLLPLLAFVVGNWDFVLKLLRRTP